MENSQEQTSLATMPPRSDSQTENLIREWLFRFGVNFQRDVAPRSRFGWKHLEQ